MELLLRLTSKKERETCAWHSFPEPLARALCSIRGTHFDVDTQQFLKILNESQPLSQRYVVLAAVKLCPCVQKGFGTDLLPVGYFTSKVGD